MPTPAALLEAALARFRDDVEGLTRGRVGRLGIAVSGGPDSMALLHLAMHAFKGKVAAATVDHGLRAAAAGEGIFVARYCERHGVPHTVLQVAPNRDGNLMAQARTARYAALHAWREANGLDWLLTGHQANDQVETLIMRLNRSSGVGGLASVRPRYGRVIRPLLGWLRSELIEVLELTGVEWIEDPTNREDRFDRSRLRKALAETSWLDTRAVSASASALGDADEALDWIATELFSRLPVTATEIRLPPGTLPDEIMRRLLARACCRLGVGHAPRGRSIGRALEALRRGEKVSLGNATCEAANGAWILRPAPPRTPPR